MSHRRYLVPIFESLDLRLEAIEAELGSLTILDARLAEIEREQEEQGKLLRSIERMLLADRGNHRHVLDEFDRLGGRLHNVETQVTSHEHRLQIFERNGEKA